MDKKFFTITEQHLKLIRKMCIGYDDDCEFGAPEVDPKRPYGNRSVYIDIGEILEIEPEGHDGDEHVYTEAQEDEMLKLHKETATALQIIVATELFLPGAYEADIYQRNWKKI
jgi:hypothetical protein